MFFKRKEFTPYPIYDKVVFRSVDRDLPLTVRADGGVIVRGLKKVQAKLSEEPESEEEQLEAARLFAAAIFGNEQAGKIVDLYDSDPLSIISVCGNYFNNRLAKIITKVQIKRGV